MFRCRSGERVGQGFASIVVSIALGIIIFWSAPRVSGSATLDLPPRLTDQQVWQLITDASEPAGALRGANLSANEGPTVPALIARNKPGRVYLGVGPEQNFTYIAATKPAMAFVVDTRQDNLYLHLMYKALFELSADRADFVSRVFTKTRPQGLTTASTATELMDGYWNVRTEDEPAYAKNLQDLQNHLTKTHALPLSQDDLAGVARVYRAFYMYGPRIVHGTDTALTPDPRGLSGTYRDLVTQTDGKGTSVSFLASDEKYTFVKDLHRKNLIVPVVGNVSGPKALRAIGAYVRRHDSLVGAFYVSNVETYLWRDGTWPAFCANVAVLPTDASSVFVRPSGPVVLEGGMGVVSIWAATKSCRRIGRQSSP
jgi:hypothetical protein